MTYTEVIDRIDQAWQTKSIKMDWSGMEDTLVAIFKLTEIVAVDKVALAKDCIDAYTKRGHFTHN